jgi:hypothetical protein
MVLVDNPAELYGYDNQSNDRGLRPFGAAL